MLQWITRRLRFWREALLRPWWLLVFALWSLFSHAATFRDNLLSPELQQKWNTLRLLPEWRWEIWAIGILVILLCLTMEGTYRIWRREQCRAENLEAQLHQLKMNAVVSSIFIIQHLHHTFFWRHGQQNLTPFHPEIVVPKGAQRVLRVAVRIEAPSLLVEYVSLEIMHERVQSDWKAYKLVNPFNAYIYFDIPNLVSPGSHAVRIVAGTNDKESRSFDFEIDVPGV